MQIFHIPNDCSATVVYLACAFSGLGQRMSYDWRATATKLQVTVSKDALCAWLSTSVQLFQAWHVQSGLTWTTERVDL